LTRRKEQDAMTDNRTDSAEADETRPDEKDEASKPSPTTDVERKVGDMGKGSHEETQGGPS
jgi:hypothetical protein